MLRVLSQVVLVFALGLSAGAVSSEITGKVRVIDGDTLDVGKVRVRLHGIDAPETDQPCTTLGGQNWACGDWITRQVRDRFQGATARCEPLDTDRYKRIVARCFVGETDIAKMLVSEGWAFAYRKYSMDYDLDEKAAFVAARGVHGRIVYIGDAGRKTTRQIVPISRSKISPASELMSTPSKPSSIGLPFTGDKRGSARVDLSMVRAGSSKSTVLASTLKIYKLSEPYATLTASS